MNAEQGFALFEKLPSGASLGQGAAAATAALNGKAGGKAQSGNSSMICLALAFRLSTPASAYPM